MDIEPLTMTQPILIIINIIGLILFFLIGRNKKITKNGIKASFTIYVLFVICTALLYFLRNTFVPAHLFMCINVIFNLSSYLILKIFKIDNKPLKNIFIFLAIMFFYIGYLSYTDMSERQHDLCPFVENGGGHFGYLYHIFTNNSLPNVNPTHFWCYYNPPLHYIISTFFLKIGSFLHIDIWASLENLEYLSFIYISIFVIYTYKIINKLFKKTNNIPLLLFLAFSPAIVILSGSRNNDTLPLMLSTMSIYYTLCWFESDSLTDLIIIALTISLAMMSKISAALISIPIAFIFLYRFITNIKNAENKKDTTLRYIKHFAIFAIIALPIGLWYPIKNYIKYDIPFSYIQRVSDHQGNNVEQKTPFERLFKFDKNITLNQLNKIDMNDETAEYNLYLTTLKSYLYDEGIYLDEVENTKLIKTNLIFAFSIDIMISILFIINIIFMIINLIKEYKNKELKDNEENKSTRIWLYFFILLFVIQIISYTKFCFDFAYAFTMNFRYIVPTLLSFIVILAYNSNKNKYLSFVNNTFLLIAIIPHMIIFLNLL